MKNLNCIYFIKNKCDFLPNRLVFQEQLSPRGEAAAIEKITAISVSEEFKKLRAAIEKSREQALKNDPESYLRSVYVLTNEKKPALPYVTADRPDAVNDFLMSLRLSLKDRDKVKTDEKTKERYEALIKKLELYEDFRTSLDSVLSSLAYSESFLNYITSHPDEQIYAIDIITSARVVDFLNSMMRDKSKYMPITTYTDILHPDAVKYVKDFFENKTLLKKAEKIFNDSRKRTEK